MTADPTTACRLRIEPYGRTVIVRPTQNLLDAALSAGLNVPHSCKSGHCASCRARLLAGSIHYLQGRPLGITQAEADTGWVLLCQARAVSAEVTVEARSVARAGDAEIRQLPCRIERRVALAPDVQQLFLRLPATEQVSFLPGQYLDVLLEDGRRRSFSLACPPHDAGLLEIHVRRVPAGRFTSQLFEKLQDGALLRVELPIGQFFYRLDSSPIIAIAGGTGFAPLKSMLRHIFERGPERDVHLYWGVRSAADLYDQSFLTALQAAKPRLAFTPVLSHHVDEGAQRRRGWVHEAVLADYPDLSQHSVYAAGPPQMIEAIRASFPAAGAVIERLYFDSFDYAPDAARAGSEPAD